jgi:hypothetical protein
MLRLSLLLCLFLAACEPVNRYFGLDDDNFGEELIETAIKYETGASIDLTPSSPE